MKYHCVTKKVDTSKFCRFLLLHFPLGAVTPRNRDRQFRWGFSATFDMGGTPKIGGKPPKWMVKIMENPIKMDDLGVPIIFGNTHIMLLCNLAFSVVSLADNGSNPLPYKEEIW